MTRRRWSVIIAVLLVVLTAAFVWGVTRSQKEYIPKDTVVTEDAERSQVYITGTGYDLTKEQKEVHQQAEEKKVEQKKQKVKEVKQNDKAEKTTTDHQKQPKIETPSGDKKDKKDSKKKEKKKEKKAEEPEDVRDQERDSDQEKDKTDEEREQLPTVKTSIVDGDIIDGTRMDFWVTATDYKGRSIPVYSVDEGYFEVTLNGEAVSSKGANDKKTTFQVDLVEGKNKIKITAYDRDGRSRSLTRKINCNPESEPEPVGSCDVKIKASILGLGTLAHEKVDIMEGDSAKDVVEKALSEAGIKGSWKGSYLKGISKHNICKGWSVSDDVREIMEEKHKEEKNPDKQSDDSLEENDIYDGSGWIYSVNGDFPDVGLNSYTMENGDDLVLYFSLADGVY